MLLVFLRIVTRDRRFSQSVMLFTSNRTNDLQTQSNGLFILHGTGNERQWVSIIHYLLYTLHSDRDKYPLFSIVSIPVPVPVSFPVECSVYEPSERVFEFLTVNIKLAEISLLASKNLTTAKKLPPMGLQCKTIIACLRVLMFNNWAKLAFTCKSETFKTLYDFRWIV